MTTVAGMSAMALLTGLVMVVAGLRLAPEDLPGLLLPGGRLDRFRRRLIASVTGNARHSEGDRDLEAPTLAEVLHRAIRMVPRQSWVKSGLAVTAGLVIMLMTRIVLMIVVVPLGVWLLPYLMSAPPQRDIGMLEALDRWVRSLAATLPTGSSVLDAMRGSVKQAPELLRMPLQHFVEHLDDQWTNQDALQSLADELDSPDADAVIAALMLATRRGGTGVSATLVTLADSVRDRLSAVRTIEAEREKPRVVVRQITLVTVVVLAAAMFFGREFFAPYATPTGQLVLAVLAATYLGSLVLLRRMTIARRRARILDRSAS